MIEISNAAAPLLVQALRDAVRYSEHLLTSETLRDRADYEEYLMDVSQLYVEKRSTNALKRMLVLDWTTLSNS